MAVEKEINDLTAQTTINTTDQFVLQETSGGTTKKTLWSTIISTIFGTSRTMSGTFTAPTLSATTQIVVKGASGTSRVIYLQTNDLYRWTVRAGTSAESGSNAGSDFYIDRYADDGSFLDVVFSIARSSGDISVRKDLDVVGALSKGSGTFNIPHPHPDKKDTHRLVHSFVEAPKADLIYSGMVDLVKGKAVINIDTMSGMTEGTFELLCRDVRRFTSNESGFTQIKSNFSGNKLTIEAEDSICTDEIFWQVIGERCDPHMYDTDWTDDEGHCIVEPLNTEWVEREEQDKKMREKSLKELKEKEDAKKNI